MHRALNIVLSLILLIVSFSYALTGVVQDGDGKPLEGVEITFSNELDKIFTDSLGSFNYTKTTPIQQNQLSLGELELVIKGNLFSLTLSKNAVVELSLYNIRGQRVMFHNRSMEKGLQKIAIPNLASGLYVLNAKIGSKRFIKKIVANNGITTLYKNKSKETKLFARAYRNSIDSISLRYPGYLISKKPVTNYDENLGTIVLSKDSADVSVNGIQLINETHILKTDSSTAIKDVTCKSGYNYKVDINQISWDYLIDVMIITPEGDTLNTNAFQASSNGTYKVIAFVDYINSEYDGSFVYQIKIIEFAPLSENLNGTWILTEVLNGYKDKVQSIKYGIDSAYEIIEIRNDSIIETSYDDYEVDSLYISSDLAIDNWLWQLKITQNGNQLQFSDTLEHIIVSYVYEKYTGAVADVKWDMQNISVPSSMIGTWYQSGELYEVEGYWEGYYQYLKDSIVFESGAKSGEIKIITSDSIIIYNNAGFGQVDTYHESISDNYWFFKTSAVENGKIVNAEIECDIEGSIWYGGYMQSDYSPYSGDLPPVEWSEFELPIEYVSLGLNEIHSGTLSQRDTLWFRIPVTEGDEYTLEVISGNFDTYMTLIDDAKNIVSDDDDGGSDLLSLISFTSANTGYLYCAINGFHSMASGKFELSFTSGLTRSRSNSGKDVIKKRDKRELNKRQLFRSLRKK